MPTIKQAVLDEIEEVSIVFRGMFREYEHTSVTGPLCRLRGSNVPVPDMFRDTKIQENSPLFCSETV